MYKEAAMQKITEGTIPFKGYHDWYWRAGFSEELSNLIKALDLTEAHILGQSWGGILLLAYMITQKPRGVRSIVLSSAPASVPPQAGSVIAGKV
jgi:pimeloyl-ACP methyl ester carboxylesterase